MVALSTKDELRSLADEAGRELEGASAVEILTWADPLKLQAAAPQVTARAAA